MDDLPPPKPKPPRPLGYRRPEPARAGVPLVAQFFVGLSAWAALVAAAYGVLRNAPAAILPTAGVALAIGLVVGLWLRHQYGWRGFLPGLLVGVGLTCLVPVGLVAYLCGNMRS